MTTLLIAEHDNASLKDSTAKALTAAKQLGGDVHVLVAGKGCKAVADAAAKISHPLDNADLDYWYRKRMAKVYTRRALAQLAGLGNWSTGVME